MAPDGSTFRNDYRFYPAANGWLKVHKVPTNWQMARLSCYLQGARLASPLNEGLYETMRSLLQDMRSDSIFIGVHTMSAEEDYYSVEGVHLSEIRIEWAEGEPDNRGDAERCLAMAASGAVMDVRCDSLRGYLCYREKQGLMAMNECGNFDKHYSKDPRTGSCYKYHSSHVTWARANTVCTAEGGHLAIINSELEAEVLKEMAFNNPRSPDFVYLGFFNWYQDDSLHHDHWATLDGKSLEEAGFARWRPGEPNNMDNNEHCGSFILNKENPLQLNDVTCSWKRPFICEIEKPRSIIW